MTDVSVREAAKAVTYDYANYFAHLFLSDSFNVLRDPTRFNLRYETPWFSEWLVAGLLSPVGGTPLSQHISQQEYSRLFQQDRIGLSSDTSYRSDGQVRELASQFGTLQNTGWSLDLDYQHNDGVRPNNELDRIEWYSTIKQQLDANDSVLLLAKYQDYHSGDSFQYYDPLDPAYGYRPHFSYDETQAPIILGGYHHEWAPGAHTLLLGGWLDNDQRFKDKGVGEIVLTKQPADDLGTTRYGVVAFDADHRSTLGAATFEAQHIQRAGRQTLIVGGRYQAGEITTDSILSNPSAAAHLFNTPAAEGHLTEDFERGSAYAYLTVEQRQVENLFLTAGLAYDTVTHPRNFRSPPISAGSETESQWGPKAALVWHPLPELTLRGAYTRSLGGVTFDQSFRLEPAQLAGFLQAFRSILPESLVGSVAAPRFETAAAVDLQLKTRTYVSLQGQWLGSEVDQTVGVFDFVNFTPPIMPSSTSRTLDGVEKSCTASVNQLLADEWAIGFRYRFARSTLDTAFPDIPAYLPPPLNRHDEADLHRVAVQLLYNHPSGFFALIEDEWFSQDLRGDLAGLAGDSFQQLNLYAGFRLRRQRGDLTLGVMNVTDEDYHLHPLNLYEELPRERVFFVRLRFRL